MVYESFHCSIEVKGGGNCLSIQQARCYGTFCSRIGVLERLEQVMAMETPHFRRRASACIEAKDALALHRSIAAFASGKAERGSYHEIYVFFMQTVDLRSNSGAPPLRHLQHHGRPLQRQPPHLRRLRDPGDSMAGCMEKYILQYYI